MFQEEPKTSRTIQQPIIQVTSIPVGQPFGKNQITGIHSPVRMAPQKINGRRRPQRVRVLSESQPAVTSVKASKIL